MSDTQLNLMLGAAIVAVAAMIGVLGLLIMITAGVIQ